MNANELAEIQAFKTEELTMWERNHTATMLRQQQAEIEELKKEAALQRLSDFTQEADNEPVAWAVYDHEFECYRFFHHKEKDGIPLYTHPAQELNDGGEPVKNATYWKRQYNEMSALNDRLKSSLYHANEQIKYLEFHAADLTDEEIFSEMLELLIRYRNETPLGNQPHMIAHVADDVIAKAILRKAQEK